jgi:hypothetical protein
MAVYPAAVWERGKRLDAKSNAEETEYERSCLPPGLDPSAASGLRGSSSEKDSFLEEGVPEAEEERDSRLDGPSVEDAREASSRESRTGLVMIGERWLSYKKITSSAPWSRRLFVYRFCYSERKKKSRGRR